MTRFEWSLQCLPPPFILSLIKLQWPGKNSLIYEHEKLANFSSGNPISTNVSQFVIRKTNRKEQKPNQTNFLRTLVSLSINDVVRVQDE